MIGPLRHREIARLLRAADPLTSGSRPQAASRRPGLAGAAAIALFALVAFGVTAPGRAAVEWAAEQVGIAEVGEPPTLDKHLSGGSRGDETPSAEPIGDPVVIGNGIAPDGTGYEIVAYTAEAGTCLALEMPERPRETAGFCFEGKPKPGGIGSVGIRPLGGDRGEGESVLYGDVGPRVKRVELEITTSAGTEEVEPKLVPLRNPILSRIGAEEPIQVMVGFVGSDTRPAQLSITAFGKDGERIDQRSIDYAGQERERERLLDQVERKRERLEAAALAAIERVRSGELELSFTEEEAERLLRLLIARGDPESMPLLSPAEANKLERDTSQLLDELRKQNAFPGIGECC